MWYTLSSGKPISSYAFIYNGLKDVVSSKLWVLTLLVESPRTDIPNIEDTHLHTSQSYFSESQTVACPPLVTPRIPITSSIPITLRIPRVIVFMQCLGSTHFIISLGNLR